jgi:hypothetical protein
MDLHAGFLHEGGVNDGLMVVLWFVTPDFLIIKHFIGDEA